MSVRTFNMERTFGESARYRNRSNSHDQGQLQWDPRPHPVSALSTLLKLLSSLSTRVGRCQYKLTPAEHALSLHLVSIIDPYVYPGAKTLSTVVSAQAKPIISGLVYQPTEILDRLGRRVENA